MNALIASFIFVFLAEMGDKTQLMAMAFAAKYSAYKVLAAVFLASLICNAVAVIAGQLLITVVPLKIMSLTASASFIIFGLWILREEKPEEKHTRLSSLGPLAAIGTAFLLAEMGDKTQLATMSLAIKYRDIFGVLAGSTLAMVTANMIAISAGAVLRRYVPEKMIKSFSAVIFILFGIISTYRVFAGKEI